MTVTGRPFPQSGPQAGDDAADSLAEQAIAWFVRQRSGPLGEAERRDFEAWLERDAGHAEAYAEAQALWGEVGTIPDPRSQDATPGRGEAPLVPPRTHPHPKRLGLRPLHGALAACLLLAGVVGLWSLGGYDRLRADYATAVGETRRVTLSDGSSVQLNTDTALAVDFSEGLRRVELYRGEAFFEVAKDAARPFEVLAGSGLSRALGTAFNVADAGEAVTVAVEQGRVRVSRLPGDQARPDAVTLRAGEAARYGRDGGIELARGQPAAALAWRQGKLVFANRRLRDVIAELDRYRPGSIVFLDSGIAGARFTGVVSLEDTDKALDAIEAAVGLQVVRLTPYLTLLRAPG